MTAENQAPEGADALARFEEALRANGLATDDVWKRAAYLTMFRAGAALAAQPPASSGVSGAAPGLSSGVMAVPSPAEGDGVRAALERFCDATACIPLPGQPFTTTMFQTLGMALSEARAALDGLPNVQPKGPAIASPARRAQLVLSEDQVGQLIYSGNTVSYLKQRADAYGDELMACWAILREAGLAGESGQTLHEALRAAIQPPAPAPQEPGIWAQYVAGMVVAYLGGGVDDERIKPIAGIIERRLWALAPSAQPPAVGAAPQEVQDAAWRKWDDTGTVGSLIAFLATLDQAEPIVTAYHITLGSGERRCKTRRLTISRERVDRTNSTIRTADTTLPYTHVLWASPPDHTAVMTAAAEAIESLLSLIRRNAPELSGKVIGWAERDLAALRAVVGSKPPVQGSQP